MVGAGLLVSFLGAATWALAWRRRVSADGVPGGRLPGIEPRPARAPRQPPAPVQPARPVRPRPGAGLLLGSDWLLPLADDDEQEAWP
ncbi:MAG TPA: hypothetical protein VIZ43_25550 [Trebonia sp.]